MILSIINSKGGVGKTTVALLLAEALRRKYGTVEVWDTDPQGSAVDWSDGAEEDGDPLSFSVVPLTKARLRKREPGTDYVVIDTPPGDPEAIDLAARRSDFVLIPTDASPMDMKRAAATLESLGAPAALLFCRVNVRTQLYASAKAWVEGEDASYLDAVVPFREDAKKIVDTGITYEDLYGVESVAAEIVTTLKEN